MAHPHCCRTGDSGCFMAGWLAPGKISWVSLTRENRSLAMRVYYRVTSSTSNRHLVFFLCQDIKMKGGLIDRDL